MLVLVRIGIWLLGIGAVTVAFALAIDGGLASVAIALPGLVLMVAGGCFLLAALIDRSLRRYGGVPPLANPRFIGVVALLGAVAAGCALMTYSASGAAFVFASMLSGVTVFAVVFLGAAGVAALRRAPGGDTGPLFGVLYRSPSAMVAAVLLGGAALGVLLYRPRLGPMALPALIVVLTSLGGSITFLVIAAVKALASPRAAPPPQEGATTR